MGQERKVLCSWKGVAGSSGKQVGVCSWGRAGCAAGSEAGEEGVLQLEGCSWQWEARVCVTLQLAVGGGCSW